eukprot:4978596-Prymnesium_polylepis.1
MEARERSRRAGREAARTVLAGRPARRCRSRPHPRRRTARSAAAGGAPPPRQSRASAGSRRRCGTRRRARWRPCPPRPPARTGSPGTAREACACGLRGWLGAGDRGVAAGDSRQE